MEVDLGQSAIQRKVGDSVMKKLCRENVEELSPRKILHHISAKNADGTPLRGRVNGKVILWKTRPLEFKVPMKYGLKTYFYITEGNANEWYFPEGK